MSVRGPGVQPKPQRNALRLTSGDDPVRYATCYDLGMPVAKVHLAEVSAWLDSLRTDAVFGWRQLNKHKATSAAAILSLGLAVGACTSVFRIIEALFLRPLPIANPERLYGISLPGFASAFTYTQFRQMRASLKEDPKDRTELIAISAAPSFDLTYGPAQEIEKTNAQFVSGWMFSSFGLRPALGRLLTESDDLKPGASPVAVLSYDYWSRRFARDPNVIGRTGLADWPEQQGFRDRGRCARRLRRHRARRNRRHLHSEHDACSSRASCRGIVSDLRPLAPGWRD